MLVGDPHVLASPPNAALAYAHALAGVIVDCWLA